MKHSWIVFCKEVREALRDRKTLAMILCSTALIGPLMLLVLSNVVSTQEERAERREVWVAGVAHAPALHNYLLRQGMTVRAAPDDYEARLRDGRLGEAVIVVPDDLEATLKQGEAPELRVVYDSGNRQSNMQVGASRGLLNGFNAEQGQLELALRGVAPSVMQPYQVQARNLASAQSRSSQLTAMIPMMVMIAMLLGGLSVALDSTAGERERASLEPLLTNPMSPWALVLGKWMAVASVAMLIACISVTSFFPAKLLIHSEALQAMFRFTPADAALFLLMLLPLGAAVSAVLMLSAIHGRTLKEAQATATMVLMGFQLAPLISVMDFSGEKPWHLWVPSLAQQTVMLRVLRGDVLHWQHLIIPTAVSLTLALLCLTVLAHRIKPLAVRH